jgi:hypothetical protein
MRARDLIVPNQAPTYPRRDTLQDAIDQAVRREAEKAIDDALRRSRRSGDEFVRDLMERSKRQTLRVAGGDSRNRAG